jgi:hypothetical protein
VLDMDIGKILAELRSKRQQIEEAIVAIQRVGGGKRRGRPPKWISESAKDKAHYPARKRMVSVEAHNGGSKPSRPPN